MTLPNNQLMTFPKGEGFCGTLGTAFPTVHNYLLTDYVNRVVLAYNHCIIPCRGWSFTAHPL